MSLDSIKQSIWNLACLRELFERLKLILELFIVSIEGGDHLSHVTNCVRIETDTKNHPQASKDVFYIVMSSNISKPNSRQRLEGPIKRNHVLLLRCIVLNSSSQDPARLEIVPFGLEEPEAANKMVNEQNCSNNLSHLSSCMA